MAALTDLLDANVPVAGREVADVGCGDGWLVRRLASRGARVVGIEPAADALAAARAAADVPGARYLQGEAQALPLGDRSIDVVILFNSLHHVPVEDMPAALAESMRVLRPDGLVYVQEPVAAGPFFELMAPVEDETAVRAAAQAALAGAARAPGWMLSEQTFEPSVRVESFEAWRAHQVLVDPARDAPIAAREDELRERFVRLARPDGDGFDFPAPARVTILRRAPS